MAERHHLICVPVPLQGHIKPMLNLAKLLHHRGFHITFVNTEFNHKRFLSSRGPYSLDGLPHFRFEAIPDGLPPSDPDAGQNIPSLCEASQDLLLAPFRRLLSKLNDASSSSGVPPVSCIVADGFTSFTYAAGDELGIPVVAFWTISACALMGLKQYRRLREMGIVPLKDSSYLTNGYLENTVIDWIPSMKNIRLRDLPAFLRTTDPNDFVFEFMMGETEKCFARAPSSSVIIHTFNALEQEVLEALSSIFPRIHAIGPLHLLLNQIPAAEEDPTLNSIGYNLWKEDLHCLHWLDSKEPNSVLYVNFGSITVMTPEQLIEFAWGLANCNLPFLWVIRPDLAVGESAIPPPEFEAETKGRGLIVSWCPQEEVLNHASIGGFLTHSGWNSTLESLAGGVPMMCWPFFADQPTNCRYACGEWGIGMEIDSVVKRGEVEKLVRELMGGEKGKEMKKRVMEWKELAQAAAASTGSSSLNLDKLVNEFMLIRNETTRSP
ncbi:7-deoxyloganetin glucosyltransferase-like [Malania oleifera]|uniref:7-deoxyloganetin glucosyltransferase-like n=1 Tax=Malania oleifera TaxID=397392 RepID=UPI0025AE3755|nr:7-deoxyloganetin glucosyltransferase-like [Malania oleifera]